MGITTAVESSMTTMQPLRKRKVPLKPRSSSTEPACGRTRQYCGIGKPRSINFGLSGAILDICSGSALGNEGLFELSSLFDVLGEQDAATSKNAQVEKTLPSDAIYNGSSIPESEVEVVNRGSDVDHNSRLIQINNLAKRYAQLLSVTCGKAA